MTRDKDILRALNAVGWTAPELTVVAPDALSHWG